MFHRNRNELAYRARAESGQLRRQVLFECYGGQFASDAVREICIQLRDSGLAGELGLELLWSVKELSVPIPEGTRPVVHSSRAWWEALATSAFLVNNNNFPFAFTKAKGQVYLQTWHGTPLKRIGNDVPPGSLTLRYRALMAREAAAWDFLLAGNQHSADVFGPAFGYHGAILQLGYPRNDPLVGDRGAARREQVRTSLGIAADQLVVLCAPTWRDNARDERGHYAMVTHLDLDRWADRCRPNHVLLVRGHVNTIGSTGAAAHGRGVRDVTRYPDVADLYLAADVLVTDYSSAMFDFSVTGRPMVFLVPDLETYRDSTRGLYLDLPTIAPGPLVRTTDEVLAILADIDAVAAEFTGRYRTFRHRFNPRDDGAAAARVVRAVWQAPRPG